MRFYYLEPEVAGGLGNSTIIDRSSGRTVVKKLDYEFYGWGGDELLETTPCFIVSERLQNEIIRSKLTGVGFGNMQVSMSQEFRYHYPNLVLPNFVWLRIHGEIGKDDFGIAPDLRLVVSERALVMLREHGISHASAAVADV